MCDCVRLSVVCVCERRQWHTVPSIRITAVPGKKLHNSVQTLVGETWRKEISGVVVEVELLDAREIACAAASVFDFHTSKASKLSTELQRQGADLVAVYEQLAEMNEVSYKDGEHLDDVV